jgi:hypothetical protein
MRNMMIPKDWKWKPEFFQALETGNCVGQSWWRDGADLKA